MSSEAATAGSNRQAALDRLHADVYERNMAPFWAIDLKNKNDEDRQVRDNRKAVPFLWSYANGHRAAALSLGRADHHRILRAPLADPGQSGARAAPGHASRTMYTAYRLNDPREIMPPHRHSPNAIRFGLTGSQNFTGVEGENIMFGPGDMVLTPHDTWHNHGNKGGEPAINLSVLDLPLVEQLNALYFEHDYTRSSTASG